MPDLSLPRANRDRVPELDELVMRGEKDDFAQSMGVDIIKGSVRTREQHTPTPRSEKGAFQYGPQGRTFQFWGVQCP
eukprot:9205621-Pyramimonas_sp.AAC.1